MESSLKTPASRFFCRSTRIRLVVAAASIGAAWSIQATSADAASRARCQLPQRSSWVARGSRAVVYKTRMSNSDAVEYVACARVSGRHTLLGIAQFPSDPQSGATGVADVVVAGRWVGFVDVEGANASGALGSQSVERVDAVKGAIRLAHRYDDLGDSLTQSCR